MARLFTSILTYRLRTAVRLVSDRSAVAAAAAAPTLLAYGDYKAEKVGLIAGANLVISFLTFDRPQHVGSRFKWKIFSWYWTFFQSEYFLSYNSVSAKKSKETEEKVTKLVVDNRLLPLFSSRQPNVFPAIGGRLKPLVYLLKSVARAGWAQRCFPTTQQWSADIILLSLLLLLSDARRETRAERPPPPNCVFDRQITRRYEIIERVRTLPRIPSPLHFLVITKSSIYKQKY